MGFCRSVRHACLSVAYSFVVIDVKGEVGISLIVVEGKATKLVEVVPVEIHLLYVTSSLLCPWRSEHLQGRGY